MKSKFLYYVLGASLCCYMVFKITRIKFLAMLALIGVVITAGYTLVYDITHHTTPWHRAKAAREELRKQRIADSSVSDENEQNK